MITYLSDLWHAARQGWRYAGLAGAAVMLRRFVPRIRASRRAGAAITWDDRGLGVYVHYHTGAGRVEGMGEGVEDAAGAGEEYDGRSAGWARPALHWHWHYFPHGWAVSACWAWLSGRRRRAAPPAGARVCRTCRATWERRGPQGGEE